MGEDSEFFARHVRDIHEDVLKREESSNEKYKGAVDSRKICPIQGGWFCHGYPATRKVSSGSYQKLQRKGTDVQVLKHLGENAYLLQLSFYPLILY